MDEPQFDSGALALAITMNFLEFQVLTEKLSMVDLRLMLSATIARLPRDQRTSAIEAIKALKPGLSLEGV